MSFPQSYLHHRKRKYFCDDNFISLEDEDINKMEQDETEQGMSEAQKQVLELCLRKRENVFFTGPGGVGKSFLLTHIINTLSSSSTSAKKMSVTSSTGISAIAIGGTTLHTFAGLGLADDTIERLCEKALKSPTIRHNWRTTQILIIDEISMISGTLFDKFETVARTVRNNSLPFGGIQLIVCGDFLQLAPVTNNYEVDDDSATKHVDFAFCAKSWDQCFPSKNQILLQRVFRQQDDVFVDILHRIRMGEVTEQDIQYINQRVKTPEPLIVDGIEIGILKMHTTKKNVAIENETRLEQINADPFHYEAVDKGDYTVRQFLEKNCQAPSHLTLKIGAEVLLVWNLDLESKLANGSRGKVIGFESEEVRNQQPTANNFKRPRQETQDDITSSSSVSTKHDGNPPKKWPIVQFENGHKRMIMPHKFEVKRYGEVVGSRTQLPLILGFCITVHKSQGMTLDRTQISLENVFCPALAYVSISRLRSIDGLFLTSPICRDDVTTHPSAVSFYKKLICT